MRCLAVCNSDEADFGLVGEVLVERGFEIRKLIREESATWGSVGNADLVVSFGSPWSVYWYGISDHVKVEASVVRNMTSRGVPFLGICFGAQLLSTLFGGRVGRNAMPEIGWHEVESSRDESVLVGSWMQWHYDSFSTPPEFETVASNNAGVQAILRGRSLGVQFHPEATEKIVSKWMSGAGATELVAAGITPSHLLDETRGRAETTSVATRRLMDWFFEDVVQ